MNVAYCSQVFCFHNGQKLRQRTFAVNLSAGPVKEIFPYLRVKGAADAIEFYKVVFGAIEVFRLTESTGRIGHVHPSSTPADHFCASAAAADYMNQ